MIFVTVGTDTNSFNRLLKKVDELIENGKINEEVIMQIGNSNYEPKNAKWFRFESYEIMKQLNQKARLVITHGGVGSILTALIFGKPVFAVPRLKKFKEHVDDQQTELVKVLDKEGYVKGIFNLDRLEDEIKTFKVRKMKSTKSLLINELKKQLSNYERQIE